MQNEKKGFYSDLTYFYTDVDDKITEIKKSDTVRTHTNALEAKMRGLEWEISQDVGALLDWKRRVELYCSGSYFLEVEEEVACGDWQKIHNVAEEKFNTGVKYNDDSFFGFNVRYMGERKDNEWYSKGYPVTGVRFAHDA